MKLENTFLLPQPSPPLLQPGRTGLTPHWEPAAAVSQSRVRLPKAEELGEVGSRMGLTPRLLEPETMLASPSASFRPIQVALISKLLVLPTSHQPRQPQ